MRNVITAELMKLKKNKLFLTSIFIAIAAPSLIVLKDLILPTNVQRLGLNEWVYPIMMVVLFMVFSILSGFIITYLIQREYGEKTIINALVTSVSRTDFIIGKIVVWVLWHIILTIICLLITYIGCELLFKDSFNIHEALNIGMLFIKASILNLISLTPILYISIKQREIFYPSLLVCVLVVGIQLSAFNLPNILGSILPWSAALILSCSQGNNILSVIGLVSIALCGLVSIILSINLFKKQNL